MTFNFKKQAGFTLAEVLITLTIIGVIAALTIPNLMRNYQKHVWVTGLQKNYSILKNAVAQAEKENGSLQEEIITERSRNESNRIMQKYIIPYVKVAKDCTNDTNNDKCTSVKRKNLANNGTDLMFDIKETEHISAISLQDGTLIGIFTSNKTTAPNLVVLILDINGDKAPNILGRDVFWLGLTFNEYNNAYYRIGQGGLFPWGLGNTKADITASIDACNINSTYHEAGAKCSALIFLDGWKMNY